MKLYGIANCNTVQKARNWLQKNNRNIPFHDFKKNGIDRDTIHRWLTRCNWQTLVNRKGLTWRGLSDEQKQAVVDDESALTLMLAKPSVIKRPVLESDERLIVGFDEATYTEIFGTNS